MVEVYRDSSGRGGSVDTGILYVGLVVFEKFPKKLMSFDLVRWT